MKKRTISTILILTMLLNFYSITTNALTTNPIIEDEFTITEIIEQNDNYEKIKVYDKKTGVSQYAETITSPEKTEVIISPVTKTNINDDILKITREKDTDEILIYNNDELVETIDIKLIENNENTRVTRAIDDWSNWTTTYGQKSLYLTNVVSVAGVIATLAGFGNTSLFLSLAGIIIANNITDIWYKIDTRKKYNTQIQGTQYEYIIYLYSNSDRTKFIGSERHTRTIYWD